MDKDEQLVQGGAVCAKCGAETAIGGEENRVVCQPCGMPTDLCTCSG